MFLSVFDLFKIGIGPSSSHTMGPMTAARRFLDEVAGDDWPRPAGTKVARIGASLHGSLAYTGVGHGSDRAVILGLAGETPQTVDPDQADGIVARITTDKLISPPGHPSYHFDPATDLVLDRKTPLTGHANGMAFHAYDAGGRLLLKRIYYSIGGGFVVSEEELQRMKVKGSVTTEGKKVPYPFKNAVEMLKMAAKSGLSIADMKRTNEETQMSREELDTGLDAIWGAMKSCIDRGLSQ
ncbi:MAG: L-serine ammonia-lyase, partial [Mesorhizobium sp.]